MINQDLWKKAVISDWRKLVAIFGSKCDKLLEKHKLLADTVNAAATKLKSLSVTVMKGAAGALKSAKDGEVQSGVSRMIAEEKSSMRLAKKNYFVPAVARLQTILKKKNKLKKANDSMLKKMEHENSEEKVKSTLLNPITQSGWVAKEMRSVSAESLRLEESRKRLDSEFVGLKARFDSVLEGLS